MKIPQNRRRSFGKKPDSDGKRELMNAIGIVAEYNPFHLGHALHVEKTHRALGEAAPVVSVMTGDFVQRGAPALLSRHARAEAAVRSGVSLVLELPLAWSLSSAEGFARGAIALLAATGVVDTVSFGSEAGRLAPLQALAAALDEPETDARIVEELRRGDGYAAARQRALSHAVGEAAARQIGRPNNILAVEYLRAMRAHPQLRPFTLAREGAGHDEPGTASSGLRSASDLRNSCLSGENITDWLPPESAVVLSRERQAGRGPVGEAALETALLSRLRMLPREVFSALPDASEGLGDRLYRAVQTQPGLETLLTAAKSRRYALARLRRMCWCAALGVRQGDAAGEPPYLRVLAADEAGRALLRRMAACAVLPVVTKPAAVRQLETRAQRVFEAGAAARDLYCLAWTPAERTPGSDWRASPYMAPICCNKEKN